MNSWPQRRLTTADFLPKESDDCYLSPDDPAWEHTGIPKLVTPQVLINNNNGSEKARIMREQNIKPGTEAWFKLWFDRK